MTTQSTRRILFLAIVFGLALSAPRLRADDDKVDGDLKKMQGTWIGADGSDAKWVITGDSLKANVNGVDYTCTLALDPKATPHASAEIAIKEGPGAGKSSKAIYKFEPGHHLIFCVSQPGADTRPNEFKAIEDEAYLFDLTPPGK